MLAFTRLNPYLHQDLIFNPLQPIKMIGSSFINNKSTDNNYNYSTICDSELANIIPRSEFFRTHISPHLFHSKQILLTPTSQQSLTSKKKLSVSGSKLSYNSFTLTYFTHLQISSLFYYYLATPISQ